jgi:deoxyribonuclease-4
MENQRANLLRAAAAAATPECPILLETPAGQGPETLQTWEEFFEFVNSLNDERIRVCIDTCHIFACGHEPISYTIRAVHSWPGLVQLIHYNDSLVPKGARLDRHAFMGAGHIGLEAMKKIAEIAAAEDIPCVIEI